MYRKNNMTKVHNGAENLKNALLSKEEWQAFVEADYAVFKLTTAFGWSSAISATVLENLLPPWGQ